MNQPQSHRGTEFDELNRLTSRIIGAAIEVHKALGPGLLESIYETAMCIELEERALRYERQVWIPAYYKGRPLGKYVIDLVVEELVVVEIKSVSGLTPVFEAQVLPCRQASRPSDQLQLWSVERRNQATCVVIQARRTTPRSGVLG
jgi:GxxExxY protein